MADDEKIKISVIDPIKPAMERVRLMLFRPFDLAKWFSIGFCAWLAHLYVSFPNLRPFSGQYYRDWRPAEVCGRAREFVQANLVWIVPLIIAIAIGFIVLMLVLTWINSRGKFMFLHCVAYNSDQVKKPWHLFRRHGNNLFVFRLVLYIVAVVVCAVFLLPIVFMIVMSSSYDYYFNIVAVMAGAAAGTLFVVTVITFLVAFKFTSDFVVPIMFLRTTSCVAAWKEFWTLLAAHAGSFVLYILFQIVIAFVIGVIIFLSCCLTCCCSACILSIPYLGTVLMLPLLAFSRAYSLYYLRQFGPQYDVFAPQIVTQPAPPASA